MKAWKLLQNNDFCRNAFTKDKRGKSVVCPSDRATQFSLQGAVYQCYTGKEEGATTDQARVLYYRGLFDKCRRAARKLGFKFHSLWTLENDPAVTKKDVVAILRKADV